MIAVSELLDEGYRTIRSTDTVFVLLSLSTGIRYQARVRYRQIELRLFFLEKNQSSSNLP